MFCSKNNSSSCKGKTVGLLLIAVLAISAGAYFNFSHNKQTVFNDLHLTLLQSPRNVTDFQLEQYDNNSLQGKWTLMFFGFSRCPQLCPTTMATLNKAYQLLQQQNIKELPQVVLVTLDPEYDSAQRINEYAKSFNSNFIGVRGKKQQLDALTHELGIAYFKTTNPGQKDSNNYSINHSGTIILFNPEGKLAGFFTTPHNEKSIAGDFIKVSNQG